jgi:tRNA pseudouridine55 synthase
LRQGILKCEEIMESAACHGLVVIDKPAGMTSRAAVDALQGAFPPGTRLGHSGTLDPLATGALVIGVGAGTRLTQYIQRMEKTYHTRLRLGARSTTDDGEGSIEEVLMAQPPSREAVLQALGSFVGEIQQIPPAYSAAKITGRRAYRLARAGRDFALGPRTVHIRSLDLLQYDYPWLEIEVHCGKGTYIRSLARDLGKHLGCGALVETLRRTRVGPFDQALAQPLGSATLEMSKRLLPLSWAVADLPRINLHESEIVHIRHGRRIPWPATFDPVKLPATTEEMAAFDSDNQLIAIVGIDGEQKVLFAEKVLPNSVLTRYT